MLMPGGTGWKERARTGIVGSMKSLQFGGGREITISIEGPQGLVAGAACTG